MLLSLIIDGALSRFDDLCTEQVAQLEVKKVAENLSHDRAIKNHASMTLLR